MNSEAAKKVIIVTVFHSLVSKNILNTEALTLLRDSDKYIIILLVPKIKKTFFETHYAHRNIVIEAIEMQTFINGFFENFMQILSRLLIDTHYLHYKRRELLDTDRSVLGWVRHFCREAIVTLFSDNTFFVRVFRLIDSFGSRKSIFTDVLNAYTPDLIFSTDLFEQLGAQLIREAKAHNIETIGMVRSWDNCLSKGLLRVKPDCVIVNNEVIKQELVNIHGVDELSIATVGLPQFDSFLNAAPIDKKDFFSKYGLDPEKRLIMFAPGGNVLSNTDPDICDVLIKARDTELLPQDVQFFVRNHPQHPADLDSFKNIPGVVVQSPGQVLDKTTHKETELTPEDQDFLRNILAHTDVLIWVATSLCLDALVYDIPQVVVNFDGYDTKRGYYHSVKRYHDEGHMKKMFALKPFRVANSSDELISNIDMYLRDSSIDREKRGLVKTQQLYKLDGGAGKRIAQILEDRIR